MAEKTLEQMVKERKRKATSRQIFEKTKKICLMLGSEDNNVGWTYFSRHNGQYGLLMTFNDISQSDNSSPNGSVSIDLYMSESDPCKRVYLEERKSGKREIIRYLTGHNYVRWECLLDSLYKQALAKGDAISAEQNKIYESDLRERFGL